MQPNIGIFNSIARISIGVTLISWLNMRQTKYPRSRMPIWLTLLGASLIAEGIARYCPITSVTKLVQIGMKSEKDKTAEREMVQEAVEQFVHS